MQHLLDLTEEALRAWLAERGLPKYRAAQIRHWLFQTQVRSFDEMTDLPKDVRTALAADFTFWSGRVVAHRTTDDGTEKLLIEWPDHQRIECVLIREGDRRTICVSTQVGCAMGCVFCASGLDGVERNLTTGEIIEQMLLVTRVLDSTERLSHIVVMGMGEPLANVNALLPALEAATDPKGLGISHRRITVSTVGLPAAIDRLTDTGVHYHLAVSLHAPNDALRNQLVPVNAKIGIDEVLAAADRYFEASGRRLTFEYVLLGGVNDRPSHARELVALLDGRQPLLNVIPYNPVAGLPYKTPSRHDQDRFLDILRHGGVNVQVRARKGDRIDAACGQLRRSHSDANNVELVALESPGPSGPGTVGSGAVGSGAVGSGAKVEHA
ncbi:MAG TPA: 23S rRNA (adenine(2503)-C(2))-methyltransferase RlmN [Pirellulales bacterium]|nr:23S rRNA (adenine(2503)-C(2))-methyltransferase RlmN [Pirellulales bacterium]